MNLLVLAPRAVDAADVRAALPDADDLEGARVLVVTPAVNQSAVAFWMSDSDEAIADAEDAASQTVRALESSGAKAHGTAGESDPMLAVQDALATFPADRVLLFAAEGEDPGELERAAHGRIDVPVVARALGSG